MKNIRVIRKSLGLTQSKMALVAEVTQATISRWESGELEPSLSDIRRIRDFAFEENKAWDDEWLFGSDSRDRIETPSLSETAA